MSISSEKFMVLLEEVTNAAATLKDDIDETDRVAALKTIQRLSRSIEKPREQVFDMALSPVKATCVRLAIDLDIFNTLAQREAAVTLDDIARVKSADLSLTERVLRLLSGVGYVDEIGHRLYSANEITREMSLRPNYSTVKCVFDLAVPAFAKMPEYYRQNNFQISDQSNDAVLQYAEQTKDSLFQIYASRPALQDDFNSFMESSLGGRTNWVGWFPIQERIIDGASQSDESVLLVDMAGGLGHDIKAFQAKFSNSPGRLVLEDQASVLEAAEVNKIEKVTFDLFKAQPIKGARVYYMKFIMHDWSDPECRQILQHVKDASKEGYSKLIIEDMIIPDKDTPVLATLWDMGMLALTNTMERSKVQWNELLSSAGFRVVNIWTPPHDGSGIIEAEPIFG